MKFLRMRPGHGEQLIAEGDLEIAGDAVRLVEEFRRQLEQGQVSSPVLLNAQQAYLQTSLARVQAQAARLADTVALFQALGGGWWNRRGEPLTQGARS